MNTRRSRRLGTALAATCLLAALPATADAAIVAYVDGGEVWASSLDGAQKVRVSGGERFWEEVAVSDSGRIAAAGREDRTKSAALTRFKVWEPNGTVLNEGTLGKNGSWQLYAYPLSFDLTGDGAVMVYGFSNSSFVPCPPTFTVSCYVFDRGHYALPVNFSGIGDVYKQAGEEWPTTFGRRVVSVSGTSGNLQAADSAPFQPAFQPWLPLDYGPGRRVQRTDVAASGTVAGTEVDEPAVGSSSSTAHFIDLYPIAGVGGTPDFAAGCQLNGAGFEHDLSIAQDASRIAWQDDGGVKVAGVPTFGGADDCVLSAPAVVISPTGTSPSIGGGTVAALSPPAPPPPPPSSPGGTATTGGTTSPGSTTSPGAGGTTAPGTTGGTTTPGGGAARPALGATVPSRLAVSSLGSALGAALTATAPAAGTVAVRLTVPAARLGLRGRPVVVASGAARAARPGPLTVRVKLTKAGRAKRAKLKRSKATVTITQGLRRSVRTTTLG